MKNLISQFISDESGAGAIEYALIILLAIAIVAMISVVLKNQTTNITATISGRLANIISTLS